jgi:hypothetical protein
MYYIASIAIIILMLIMLNKLRWWRRKKLVLTYLPILSNLAQVQKYEDILRILENKSISRGRYRLAGEQRQQILEYEIKALEKLGRIADAVIALADELSANYPEQQWPDALLSKWLILYKSCPPIPIEKFYFCPDCGVHPKTLVLLDYAIEQGCIPPEGYLEKARLVKTIIEFRGKDSAIYK